MTVDILTTGEGRKRSLWGDFRDSFRNTEFWALSGWLDVVVRYRQSRLGLFWLIAPSFVFVWGLGGFFAAVTNTPTSEFAAYVGVGYLLYRLFSTVIVESTSTFAASSAFIMDGHTRLTDFILRVVAREMLYFVVALPAVFIAMAVYPNLSVTGVLLALPSLLLIMFNVLWIGVVFGLVGARFPDLSQFIGNVFLFAFLLTPIVWHAESIPPNSLRHAFMLANPLYHMVELVRAPMLGDSVSWVTLAYLGVMTVLGWSVVTVAYRRYANYVPVWI